MFGDVGFEDFEFLQVELAIVTVRCGELAELNDGIQQCNTEVIHEAHTFVHIRGKGPHTQRVNFVFSFLITPNL